MVTRMSTTAHAPTSLFPVETEAPIVAAQRRVPVSPPGERLSLCVLGSGSGGNCSVVHFRGRTLLIDLGLGPRATLHRLTQLGIDPSSIDAAMLTHLDQDHFRPHWARTAKELGLKVFAHRWHMGQLERCSAKSLLTQGLVEAFDGQAFAPLAGLSVSAVPLPHDDKGTMGFRVDAQGNGGSLGYATDLGHVPPELVELFSRAGGVDLLAIESNYDPPMQLTSSRPWFLKQRIMGRHGHLSNEQAFEAVRRIVEGSAPGRPQHIVLLHRSAQCNDPAIVLRVFAQDQSIARRTRLTHQRRRSRWFVADALPTSTEAQMKLWFTYFHTSTPVDA